MNHPDLDVYLITPNDNNLRPVLILSVSVEEAHSKTNEGLNFNIAQPKDKGSPLRSHDDLSYGATNSTIELLAKEKDYTIIHDMSDEKVDESKGKGPFLCIKDPVDGKIM